MFGGRRRGWLRPWILSMLETGPKNGADIITEVEKASMGWWRPSPGSVYPLLESMVQDGLVTRHEDGKYEITAKGRDEAAWVHGPWGPMRHRHRPASMEAILSDMESYVSYFEDVAKSDKQKLNGYSGRIKALKERLVSLTETLST
jgi:DNA-binding PadR family transcriptional regulator